MLYQMDRRWPWKKKSSDKAGLDKAATVLDTVTASSQANQVTFLPFPQHKYFYIENGSVFIFICKY